MSRLLEEKLTDLGKWYFDHRNDGRSIDMEIKFQKKTIDCLMECLAIAAKDIQDLEGRPRESLGQRLWLPSGMKVSGDLTRHG